MTKQLIFGMTFLFCSLLAEPARAVVSTVEGTVKKVDSTAKTIVVKAADGTEHTFHFVGRTTVHGAEEVVRDRRMLSTA